MPQVGWGHMAFSPLNFPVLAMGCRHGAETHPTPCSSIPTSDARNPSQLFTLSCPIVKLTPTCCKMKIKSGETMTAPGTSRLWSVALTDGGESTGTGSPSDFRKEQFVKHSLALLSVNLFIYWFYHFRPNLLSHGFYPFFFFAASVSPAYQCLLAERIAGKRWVKKNQINWVISQTYQNGWEHVLILSLS